jgi:superfamily I DNA and RNA helicase
VGRLNPEDGGMFSSETLVSAYLTFQNTEVLKLLSVIDIFGSLDHGRPMLRICGLFKS